MKITDIELAERVEEWQERLASLGIGHFVIEAVSIVDATPGGPDAKASVQVATNYDIAHFWFTHEFLAETEEQELEQTIIHEWVHVAMRDLDFSLEPVENWMPPATFQMWDESVDHEREGFVDRIAQSLYLMWYA